eukprot:SAG11_NODE_35104_length_268_cov_0.911243_1_plen_38_part_01
MVQTIPMEQVRKFAPALDFCSVPDILRHAKRKSRGFLG